MDESSQDWDRQPYDSDRSWPYFVAYRDLTGARRIDKVRLAVDGTTAPTLLQLRKWYESGRWKARTEAYDRYMAKVFQEEKETTLRAMARDAAANEAALLQDGLELAKAEMAKVLDASRKSDAIGLVKIRELIALMKQVITLGRLSRGESTDNIKEVDDFDLTKLSDEDLAQWEALSAKVRK